MEHKKKVLLIEPNYANKYPPVGLMKIATYYRNRGDWEVVFFKGDLKEFVLDRITNRCIKDLYDIDSEITWQYRKDEIYGFIKTRKKSFFTEIHVEESSMEILVTSKIHEYKDYYWKGLWKQDPEWDRVGITTLFTFYWDITIETIEFAKLLVKDKKDLMIGGVLASIQPDEIERATGIRPHVGILNTPGELDEVDQQIIDDLPLDYSILDEIEYKYPMSNAFYGYTTRGCIRHCAFCAVPTLEPVYNPCIPISEKIKEVRDRFGDQRDLLLMDNNVLASKHFDLIVEDLIKAGFGKGEQYTQPHFLEISVRNLKDGFNDRAYIRKTQNLLKELSHVARGDDSYIVFKTLRDFHVDKLSSSTKENLINAYETIKNIAAKYYKPSKSYRSVDFNQGVDARLFTPENVKLLAKLAIKPLRIAFDDLKTLKMYDRALRLSAAEGIRNFSNYLLYNFKDEPLDLYKRLKINVDLCEELDVNIYSFPMKYHPLRKEDAGEEDFSHNRNYIGTHWNRKYIRAIQAILNSTKGKVGRGKSFFYEAFGKDEAEYMLLLEMPETFIIYRMFFKWLDTIGEKGTDSWKKCWTECKENCEESEWQILESLIHGNSITFGTLSKATTKRGRDLLSYYINYREDIITPGTRMYKLKCEFDQL